MTIKYIVPGKKRKELAHCIGTWLGEPVEYLGTPTCAYKIDYFTLDKDGALSFDDSADSEVIERLIEHLYDEGFEFEEPNNATDAEEPISGICISVPLHCANVDNLMNLIKSKESLIKKAIGASNLSVMVANDKISFPWFKATKAPDEIQAYDHFVCALCKLSLTQKRVSPTEKTPDNEKYAFRCFLLRLGFIGDEFKTYRKILLRNLEGSSAFKGGKPDENAD